MTSSQSHPDAPKTLGKRLSRYTTWVAIVGSIALAIVVLLAASALQGCANMGVQAGSTLRLDRTQQTPKNARVIIDEQYVGPLAYVAARGVRLTEGEHRIPVIKEGYFPFDEIVTVEGREQELRLDVELVPIPD
jgi:hypothetical protein